MLLLADSGATKTDWYIGNNPTDGLQFQTEGINPFHQSPSIICTILEKQLLPHLPVSPASCHRIFFYGAGCTPTKSLEVARILQIFFTNAQISVESDLLGAARSACKDHPGIACILGTGSNSCLYDGRQIVRNIPPLGYILGDEGSGAYLGKRFIGDCLKGQLPEKLRDGLLEEYSSRWLIFWTGCTASRKPTVFWPDLHLIYIGTRRKRKYSISCRTASGSFSFATYFLTSLISPFHLSAPLPGFPERNRGDSPPDEHFGRNIC